MVERFEQGRLIRDLVRGADAAAAEFFQILTFADVVVKVVAFKKGEHGFPAGWCDAVAAEIMGVGVVTAVGDTKILHPQPGFAGEEAGEDLLFRQVARLSEGVADEGDVPVFEIGGIAKSVLVVADGDIGLICVGDVGAAMIFQQRGERFSRPLCRSVAGEKNLAGRF